MGVSFGFYGRLDLLGQALAGRQERTGSAVADVVVSDANGRGQIRQLLVSRSERAQDGVLEPMPVGFLPEDLFDAWREHLAIGSSLVGGMTWRELFWSSFNARASMCEKKLSTGKAGDLTRRLVYALRPCTVAEEDCGLADGERSVRTCHSTGGVCARCYGELANGGLPPVGYPAGLVAAQSIGERGTQLAMKSAHAGGALVDIDAVRKLILTLDGRAWTPDAFDSFRDLLCGAQGPATPYARLDPRHIEVLWRVLCGEGEVRSVNAVLRAVDEKGDLESLTRQPNLDALKRFLSGGSGPLSLRTPSAQILFNQSGKEVRA